MMMPIVMAKGVVAKMAARYRATAMLDSECAGDWLTCTEDQSQTQNRSDCLVTHIKSAPIADRIRFFVQAIGYVVAAPITRQYKSRDCCRDYLAAGTSE
jgi:hypothetical protein